MLNFVAPRGFICKDVHVRLESTNTPFTASLSPQKVIRLPIAHADGNFYADSKTIKDIVSNNQIIFRYCDSSGRVTKESNPNGSIEAIAGICNKRRNVLGLMPHPERCAEGILGNTDGRALFESLLSYAGTSFA